MPEPDFRKFRSELLQAGIAPRHVRRTVIELHEHIEDLVEAEIAAGCDADVARQNATREMGDLQDIAIAMRACPELQSWSYRYPHLAVVVYPLTCLALIPVYPVIAGVTHAGQLARWSACLFLGGFVTAAMFLILQLSIAFA
jgi:hypothetical protein